MEDKKQYIISEEELRELKLNINVEEVEDVIKSVFENKEPVEIIASGEMAVFDVFEHLTINIGNKSLHEIKQIFKRCDGQSGTLIWVRNKEE
jgi:hypothetical protein